MAFGTTKGDKRDVVFLDLRTNAGKDEGVGFQQVLSKTPNPDTAAKSKWIYEKAVHQFVEGRIINFKVSEESVYEKPDEKYKVGNLRLRDVPQQGVEAGPDVMVKFRLDSGHGRKLMGLIANAMWHDERVVHIKTNRADAGEKIGDQVLEKARAFVTMNVGDRHGKRVDPPYYLDAEKGEVRTENGVVAELPRGVQHIIAKKTVWDFAQADAWTEQTAEVIQRVFTEVPHERDIQNDSHVDDGGDGIDLGEAAAAAAPHG